MPLRALRAAGRAIRRRPFATISWNQPGPAHSVANLVADQASGPLADKDLAIKILAAPVSPIDLGILAGKLPCPTALPAIPGQECVGIVTAVGPKVSQYVRDDWVVPVTERLGTWRSDLHVSEDDVIKVPTDIPVEYLANLHAALTATILLKSVKAGDYLLQYGADSLIGLAIVQMAALRGIHTINVLPEGPQYYDRAGLVKEIGGDVVFKDSYIETAGIRRILDDLPKPKLSLAGSLHGSKTVLPLLKGGKVTVYGGASSEPLDTAAFSVKNWFKKASALERAAAMEEVLDLFRSEKLHLWIERHPIEDIKYALYQAEEPGKVRRVTLILHELPKTKGMSAEEVASLAATFEDAFAKLRSA